MTYPGRFLRAGVIAVCVTGAAAACDRGSPAGPAGGAFTRYVAVGTGLSMGVQSDGVNYATQVVAWPALLARQAGGPALTQPLVRAPGCPPPLVAPLFLAGRLRGTLAGDTTCSSLYSDVPHVDPQHPQAPQRAGDVAIADATAGDALSATPELVGRRSAATARDTALRKLYERVLPLRETQVAAMAAQRPTLVSVELGFSEVLRAVRSGVAARAGTFEEWRAPYDSVVDSVARLGARGVLVGVPRLRAVAGLRAGNELARDSAALDSLGVTLAGCGGSANLVFVPGALVPALAAARTTGQRQQVSCAEVPGGEDLVLGAADAAALDALVARMNAHADSLARRHGFAFAAPTSWEEMVAARPPFSVATLLRSSAPYDIYVSLDGVFPSAAGHELLADAVARALNDRYGLGIPLRPSSCAICAGAP